MAEQEEEVTVLEDISDEHLHAISQEYGCPFINDSSSDDTSVDAAVVTDEINSNECGNVAESLTVGDTVREFFERVGEGAQNIFGHWAQDGAAMIALFARGGGEEN